jgi:ATP-dependent helicase/nuclease subunit B
VLPGLDADLADDAWKQVDESHPQGNLKRLLEKAGLERGAVSPWDPETAREPAGRWRRRLVNEALRPPIATADWLTQIRRLREEAPPGAPDAIAQGLEGLTVIAARAEEEAAAVAALLLRETLETPGRTAALVTPDDALARRVSARLTRWAITADSSAGQPLASAPVAVLAVLLARAAAEPLDPVTLLAILKHPLTRLGLPPERLGPARTELERRGLRGPRPAGWDDLEARLAAADAAMALTLLEPLRPVTAALATPYAVDGAAPAADAARALAQAMETLATESPGRGPGDLWGGQAGEALAALMARLIGDSDALPPITPRAFANLLEGLLERERLRSGGASHPRLQILGVLEARLVRADRLILAGLEEGVWPRAAPIDPFLSRPMRESLGLAPPERRIGLSAHDFAQAACAPEVILLHSERIGGAPSVQSRWLWRLQTLAAGAGLELPGRPEVLSWARALDAPIADPPRSLRPAPRPAARPAVAARPRMLAVTAVERWLRDPYGLYAREILKLRPLDRPDEPVEARARGTAFHGAFERFAREHPGDLPPEPEAVFTGLLLDELRRAGMPASRMARERALAVNVAPWVVAFERRRRPGARLVIESQGRMTFAAPAGVFTLTARADRIEARGAVADILDFKTGRPPSAKQVEAGLSPQLTLTGAILAAGGFAELGRLWPRDLLYVRVSGGRIPGDECSRAGDNAVVLADEALAGLQRRVAAFDRQETPYRSWACPQFIGRFGGDYDHLARLWEWYVMGDDTQNGEA